MARDGLARPLAGRDGIVGITDVDTRALTRHLRTHGAKRGVVSATDTDRDSLVAKARASRSMVGLDLAREVTCKKPWAFDPAAEGAGAAGPLVPVRSGARARGTRPSAASASSPTTSA